MGDEGKGSGRRELAQSPGRPGSRPDAINKPSPARHRRVHASSAAPRAVEGGSCEASADSVYTSAREQTQAGCEKHFRSIKFLPLTRCQNSPGRGYPEPAGRAAPPPRHADSRGSPRARPISCQFVWEEGSRGETKRQRARRGERAALPRGNRAPAEARKLARPTALSFQRKRGLSRLTHSPTRDPGPWKLAACRSGPDLRSA